MIGDGDERWLTIFQRREPDAHLGALDADADDP